MATVAVTTVPSAFFARPADTNAYTSGDLVANSTVAGSVAPLSFAAGRTGRPSGSVRRVRLRKSGTTVTAASFRLHLYGANPTVANGDNGVWSSTQSSYLGSFSLDMSGTAGRVFSDGTAVLGTPDAGTEIAFAGGTTLYGLLEARGAYVPASGEVFTVELECRQD